MPRRVYHLMELTEAHILLATLAITLLLVVLAAVLLRVFKYL